MDKLVKDIGFSAVQIARGMVVEVEQDYLRANGWKEIEIGRWATVRPWGTGSEKRYEANRLDAVNLQAKWDGHLG